MENGENPDGPLKRFEVTMDEVERKTGLRFPCAALQKLERMANSVRD